MKRAWKVIIVGAIAAGCVAAGLNAKQQTSGFKVATYNIGWWPENANPERIKNVKSVIANLKAEVIGLEEIQSKASLTQIFGDEWQIGIADEPGEYQEVAIAVKKPNKLVSSELIFKSESLDFAFPGKRDVLRSVVETKEGKTLVFYTLHMKSRSGGRKQTDAQREMAAGLLAAYMAGQKDENSVVFGDMNDSPDDRSLSILESGDVFAKPVNIGNGPLLFNLFEPLYKKDYITFDLHSLFVGDKIDPVIENSRKENERTRGIDYRYPQDLEVTQVLFDQILVSPKLAPGAQVGVYADADAMRGDVSRTRRNDAGVADYQYKGSMASDHLPVWAILKI